MSALMDYKSTLIKLPFIFLFMSVIAGCDVDISPEPLRIIGPSSNTQIDMYYDSEFKYEFGASGGDGVYRYRYIQNPIEIDSITAGVEENTVEMSIEVTDDAKPSFLLRAVPKIPTDIPFDELNTKKLQFGIELTDGKNTVTNTYSFNLKKNTLSFVTPPPITEGQATDNVSTRLRDQLEKGETRVCEQIKDKTFEAGLNASGEYVFPHVFQVITNVNVAKRTEFFYRINTSYNEEQSERSSTNIRYARKGVDYVDQVNSFVLEPGNATCAGYIHILDDQIPEDDETISIEFFKAVGGSVDVSTAKITLEIRDNELKPVYEPKNVVRNQGDTVVVPIRLSRQLNTPLNIIVSVDNDKTTATDQDYVIEPESGVVTIPQGNIEASFTVRLLKNNVGSNPSHQDKLISIQTDLDNILKVEPYTIEINQWSDFTNIETEIVAKTSNNEEAIDFVVDGDGIVTTLLSSNAAPHASSIIKSFNRDSTPYSVSQSGELEFSKAGISVIPKSIVSETVGTLTTMAVILNVDGKYLGGVDDKYYGGTDFVVIMLQKEQGGYLEIVSAKQYGTEGDDTVAGAKLNNNTLYVYGKTNGSDFEGAPSFDTNNGGNDGFLYAINFPSNSYKWSRFIGKAEDDNLVGLAVGNRGIVTLASTLNTDEDAFVHHLFSINGLDQYDDNPVEIKTKQNDRPVAVQLDSSASGFMILLDSDASLDSESQLTDSLSRDVQLLAFDAENKQGRTIALSTLADDTAKSLEVTPNKSKIIISGDTLGEFEDNQKRGGLDAFTAITKPESSSDLKLIQFGTPGDDSIISVKVVSDTKYFVLWKENYSETGSAVQNQFVYRISAFSSDGKKLSRDPF